MALRYVLLEASHGREDVLDDSLEWRKIQESLRLEGEYQQPPRRTDGTRLDHFLQAAINRSLLGMADVDDLAVASLRESVSQINCEICAQEAKAPPCTGSPTDPLVVTRAGHCIRPLRLIFDQTMELAAGIHRRALGIENVAAELATELGRPLPLNGTPMTITGQVFWGDEGNIRKSEVKLCIDVTSIDRSALDMLPYIMAHEVFCHVYQFALGGPREGEPDQYCGFAEGWMDYVAALIVRGGLWRLEHTPWPEPEIGDVALTLHQLRRLKIGTKPFQGAVHVRMGARAAEAVHGLYEKHQLDSGVRRSAWEDFVDLSCLLNASPAWTDKLRGTILPSLARRLGRGRPEDVDCRLVDALLRWRYARGNEADALDPVISALSRQP